MRASTGAWPRFLIDTPGLAAPPEAFRSNPELYFKLQLIRGCPEFPDHDPEVCPATVMGPRGRQRQGRLGPKAMGDGSGQTFARYLLWKCHQLQFTAWLPALGLDTLPETLDPVLDALDPDRSPRTRQRARQRFFALLEASGLPGQLFDRLPPATGHPGSLQLWPRSRVVGTDWKPGRFRNITAANLPRPIGRVPKKLR